MSGAARGVDGPDAGNRGSTPRRMTRRGFVVLGIVLLALLAFGSTTQTWLTVRLPQDAVQTPDLEIAGSDAAVPVTAFALVALAAALAVSIAGRVARWIIAVILVLAGAGTAVSALGVALDPRNAAEPAIGTAIGISGADGAEVDASAFPWLAVVAGVLLVLAAAWVVLAGRTWGLNRRYDAGAARVGRPAASGTLPADGDVVPAPSIGDIPPGVVADANPTDRTNPSGGSGARAAVAAGSSAAGETDMDPDESSVGGAGRQRKASAHADEIDSWDQLSRGNDPTG